MLMGINLFTLSMFQQSPDTLGIRSTDYMYSSGVQPLVNAGLSAQELARNQSARLTVERVRRTGDALEVAVRVENLAGHRLPSGVGFRRAFIELAVTGGRETLWASGRTNALGVILRGTTNEALPTEFWQPGPDGLPFQPHHQLISSQEQVQIYEEVTQNASLEFTSSFLHRYWELKDNRLRPQGYTPMWVQDPTRRQEYAAATRPGQGPEQHWWPKPAKPERYRNPASPAIASYTDTKGDPDYTLAVHPKGLPGTDSLVFNLKL
jgi:hypothetical protein